MTRPKRTCAEPGCPVLVTKGHCLRHNRNRHLREGRSPSEQRETMRRYDRRWKKMRKIILARDPICKSCEAAPSTEVDHIIPRSPDLHAADVTEEELQGLCKPCHSSKTQAENAPKSKAGADHWVVALPKSKRRRKSKDGEPASVPDEP